MTLNSNRSQLSAHELSALEEIKRRVSSLYPVRQFVLFGSRARGQGEKDSDIDLLIITGRELTHREEHCISGEIFEVNLAYDTLFSFIAISEEKWNSRMYHFLPIHINILRDGIPV